MFCLYLPRVWKGTEAGWLRGGPTVGSEQLLQDVGAVVVAVSAANYNWTPFLGTLLTQASKHVTVRWQSKSYGTFKSLWVSGCVMHLKHERTFAFALHLCEAKLLL